MLSKGILRLTLEVGRGLELFWRGNKPKIRPKRNFRTKICKCTIFASSCVIFLALEYFLFFVNIEQINSFNGEIYCASKNYHTDYHTDLKKKGVKVSNHFTRKQKIVFTKITRSFCLHKNIHELRDFRKILVSLNDQSFSSVLICRIHTL